jgi:HB1, ASXL, restriction endonuclease HTH domain
MAANHFPNCGDTKMKKAEVKIGGKYYANVTNKRVEIQIDSEKPSGGWNATNLATGKKIHIKSAQRLLGVAGKSRAKGSANVTTEGNVTIVEVPPVTVETIDNESIAITKSKSKPKKEVTSGEPTEKRLSALDAALKVLSESPEPLNAQQMVEAMSAKGYWSSPGGKTPHATLYSAILRELAKGDASRFVKTERGRFIAAARAEVTQ